MGDLVFGMARWKSLLDWLSPQDQVACYQNLCWERVLNDPTIPQAARLGLPEFLYERFQAHFGKEQTLELGKILNEPAPTVARANGLKITRDSLLARLKERFQVSPTQYSKNGIVFAKREPLLALPEFQEGLFELQDEGSQLVADLVEAKPGESVLDYCAGSGGKTLAIAPRMQGKGQIYLHDIRRGALLEAKKRLKRAGIQNGQMGRAMSDWVLVDAPCSGSGTLRRNPDQKWNITKEMVAALVETQKKIVQEAIHFVKPGGRLVYATCSLLPEENDVTRFGLEVEKEITLLPKSGGMDGFFAAVFKKPRL